MNAIQQTHWLGCWEERSHHQCAVRLIAELNDCAEEAGYNREALKKAYAEIKKLRAQPVQPALTTNSAQISSGLVVDPEYSEDLPNPLAKARDEFMLGPEGTRLCDALGIGAPARCGLYLRDRIEAAFVAGWNACEQENNRDAE